MCSKKCDNNLRGSCKKNVRGQAQKCPPRQEKKMPHIKMPPLRKKPLPY